jgi:RNA recognition motif-containing protein
LFFLRKLKQRDTKEEGYMQNNKLFVGNLSYSVTRDQLKDLFAEYGEVEDVRIIEGKGFGFVEMVTQEAAEKAKTGLNGTELMGRTLNVDIARPPKDKERKGPRRY